MDDEQNQAWWAQMALEEREELEHWLDEMEAEEWKQQASSKH